MQYEVNNIYYFSYINIIGGIETFFYYMAKKYKDFDLTIVYRDGDANQIKRLSKLVRCVKFQNGMTFKCKKAFFNFNIDIINNVTADEYILVLHGDYKAMIEQGQFPKQDLPLHEKINKYVGVSKLVCDSWKELTGTEAELCYNPFYPDEPKKVLNLVSATRLTREKGKSRMIKLMEELDKKDIPYTWTIFTNDTDAIINENIIYKKPRLDIINFINQADYLVQLSDNEGYCYSIIEALNCGTPVICTPCPVFPELGLVEGENCYLLNFEMDNVDIDKIYNHIPQFEYTPKKDNWNNLFAKGKTTYNPDKEIEIEAIQDYFDVQRDEHINKGDVYSVKEPRADEIVNAGLAIKSKYYNKTSR